VIQSAAEGIGQSEVRDGGFDEAPDPDGLALDVDDSAFPLAAGTGALLSPSEDEDGALSAPDEPESDEPESAPDEPESAPDEPESDDPSSPFDDAPDLIAARRSFLAQPVPR
jgi:hypothetical protein